jgi:hypothetical protein
MQRADTDLVVRRGGNRTQDADDLRLGEAACREPLACASGDRRLSVR